MSALSTFGLISSTVVLVAFPDLVQAQQHDITAEEVKVYFQQIQREATEMVEKHELHRMTEWTERNIADGATFQASLDVVRGGKHKAFVAVTLSKEDLLRLEGVFVGAFRQQEIEQYSLEAEITNVIAHGPGAASVGVRWRESYAVEFNVPREEAQQMSAAEPLRVEQEINCSHILQRGEERLRIGLSTCTGEVRFSEEVRL